MDFCMEQPNIMYTVWITGCYASNGKSLGAATEILGATVSETRNSFGSFKSDGICKTIN
jgi:hypothetical protein